MKKTLAALAVLGAFAGSAMAADVTLYGAIDQGLSYTYSDVKGFDGSKVVDGDNTFEMTSGIDTASKFGLKGVEDLGNESRSLVLAETVAIKNRDPRALLAPMLERIQGVVERV